MTAFVLLWRRFSGTIADVLIQEKVRDNEEFVASEGWSLREFYSTSFRKHIDKRGIGKDLQK